MGDEEIDRLKETNEVLFNLLKWSYEQFTNIQDCHMDCDVPDSEHKMFKLAQEGIERLHHFVKPAPNNKESV